MTDGSVTPDQRLRIEADRTHVNAMLADVATALDGKDPVSSALRYAVTADGKRLRPILCLAAFEAAGGERREVHVIAATCIELVHTYSLVHDDLPCMDDDDLRRGRPTAHRIFGTPAALLAGAALIPLACRLLHDAGLGSGLGDAGSAALVRELCSGAGAAGMVGGQVLDLEAEHRDVTLDELRRIHAMKTGALFRAALRIGALLARAPGAQVDALGDYGARLGLAFQIADDLLDVTMDAAALGKTPGKDREAGKSTFVALLGIDGARAAAAAEAAAARAALEHAGVATPLLHTLLGVAVHRNR
ncbi:MAG TPA: farnesyl diphosphate synthase [Longimicrobiales bacterium]|nr:farnesyl diphosphate synthase [Longimicrobiales bacterium]